jgi:SAM-dependent methyltransferase
MYQINLRDNIINRSVENRKFKYAIDLGCGTGFHLKTLSRYSETLIGTDMSLGALKECKKNIDVDCDYVVCDIKLLPFKNNTIDFVWISGVLHHIPCYINIAIYNISLILRHNGFVLIDEPNKLNFFNYINMKLSKADPTGKERPLSLNNIKRLLATNNFLVLDSNLYEFFSPIGIIMKNNIIMKLFILLDKYMNRTFLKNIQLRWYILASR